MIWVCGRKIKVATGTKSQTVNICSEENVHGLYDYVVRFEGRGGFIGQTRLQAERFLQSRDFDIIEDFVHYLTDDCGGVLEQSPELPGKASACERSRFEGDEWVQGAVVRVDSIVDEFVHDFVDRPYLHRVEHSLHCELYQMLCRDDVIGREVRMGDFATRLVHKEWPEFRPREGKGRRGNSDLVVLSPNSFAACPMPDFLDGRIEAPFVIELGLNCRHTHLKHDLEKLLASGVLRGYLIHLVHNRMVDNYGTIEKCLIDTETRFPHIGTAYARIEEYDRYYKLVGDGVIRAKATGNVAN